MSLDVNAYVTIREGCPIAISVHKTDHVEIVCGWAPQRAVEFSMHREALRAFIEVGAEALEGMDRELCRGRRASIR